MHFLSFVRQRSGCLSYLIGAAQGESRCAIIDPAWDIAQYLEAAAARGLRITYVFETHAHADHLSGARKLAARTGAELVAHPDFGANFPVRPAKDGEVFHLGEVGVTALHSPGHRPESLTFAVTDRARQDQPWLLLTGDTLFVGDVGRPDLGQNPEEGARALYATLFKRLLLFPDWTEVYPAHGMGSACGRALSDKLSSTIGFERRFNPALSAQDSVQFSAALLATLPHAPPNFGALLRKNRGELPIRTPQVDALSAQELVKLQRAGTWILDVRDVSTFAQGFIPGAVNVPLRQGDFSANVGWAIPAEQPFALIASTAPEAREAAEELLVSGLDDLRGIYTGDLAAAVVGPLATFQQIEPRDLAYTLAAGTVQVVDVRDSPDWKAGHIPGAVPIPLSDLETNLAALDPTRLVAFVCGSGIKANLAASKAHAQGLRALNVRGGMQAWHAAGLSVE